MYYDLTKEQYKQYSKKFRKTYVGSQWFKYRLFYGIASAYFILCFGLDLAFEQKIEYMEIIFLVMAISMFFIAELVLEIQYRKELKEFINTKKKD